MFSIGATGNNGPVLWQAKAVYCYVEYVACPNAVQEVFRHEYIRRAQTTVVIYCETREKSKSGD